ncbi:hypothetical protein LWI28_014237 [Acer negundo]|uniref:Probable purine permease n=1 Tax=Acer negundo TaxID=4023 RepID=A0AAD5JFS3_ACENE|nr:hypothetical protein LWI28_014237 [Acer negundo]KAK4859011.1 hypothetical protein QYF36_025291 [Acer negundo]
MREAHQEVQPLIIVEETKEANSTHNTKNTNQSTLLSQYNRYKWWLRIALYTMFVLVGQSVAVILGRLYYVKGGKSRWMVSLLQVAGFPILLVYYCISKNLTTNDHQIEPRSSLIVAAVYVSLGLITATLCFLISVGVQYLPVSTMTLISASQLAFNAFFSFLLNSQKFTPMTINCLVLLTISSVLLVFNNDSANPTGVVSEVKYVIGFICSIAGAAMTGLVYALTQLAFRKVLKRGTFKENMDLIICQSIVATSATLVGLFSSGEWKGLTKEMEEYELGKVSYIMTIACDAIGSQVCLIGVIGLIFEVSSLFCNAIIVLGLPVVPVLSVIVFHDKMDGVKVISMVLAIWGTVSYVYQQYLDERKSKTDTSITNE